MRKRRLREKAKDLFIARQFDDAADVCRQLLGVSPEDAEAHYLLGVSLLDSSPSEAAFHLVESVKLQPSQPERLYQAAGPLFVAGYVDESLMYVHRALEIAPDTFPFMPRLLGLRGRIAAHNLELATAEEYLTQAVARDPSDASNIKFLAMVLNDLGRHREALAVVERGISVATDPDMLRKVRDGFTGQP